MSLKAESDVASGGNWSEAIIQEAYGVKLCGAVLTCFRCANR